MRRRNRRSNRRKNFGYKASGDEYCSGYNDEHGQWNTGFFCPKSDGPDKHYCCGPKTHRYCCPRTLAGQQTHHHTNDIPLILGILIGGVVVACLVVMAFCYFCHGCVLYKKRKRRQASSSSSSNRSNNLVANYSACPHQTCRSEDFQPNTCYYPVEHPPPYPGDFCIPTDDKQPLNPSDLCSALDAAEHPVKISTFGTRSWDKDQYHSVDLGVATSRVDDLEVSESDEMTIPLKSAEDSPAGADSDS